MNLGNLLEKAYRGIHDEIVDGVCTTGGTISLVDTQIIAKYNDGRFKNYTCFVPDTGEYTRVSSNVNSTGSITFAATIGSVTAGDQYAVVKNSIPLYTGVRLANDALTMLGRIWMIDTSGTTAVGTRNYTLATATKGMELRSVYLRDTNNWHYDAPAYDIIPAVGGTATTTLMFRANPSSGKTIVINYLGIHPALSVFSSAVNETIPDRLIETAVIERFLNWKKMPKQRRVDVANWQEARVVYEEALKLYPITRPQKENRRVPISMYN